MSTGMVAQKGEEKFVPTGLQFWGGRDEVLMIRKNIFP